MLNWGKAVLYGLLIGVVAQIGDLMESMIKRDCERKDAPTRSPASGASSMSSTRSSSPGPSRLCSGCDTGRELTASCFARAHPQKYSPTSSSNSATMIELERDLEGQRLEVIERFRERIEDRFDDLDAFVDLAPEATARPSRRAEPAIEPATGLARRSEVAAGLVERAFEFG